MFIQNTLRHHRIWGVLALLAMGSTACSIAFPDVQIMRGSGNVKTESRQVSGFSTVLLSGIGSLTIVQAGTEGLAITAEDNLLPLITTQVQGSELDIGIQTKPSTTLHPTKPILYVLSVKDLTTITLSGAGSIATEHFTANALTVNLRGAGAMNLGGLQLSNLTATLSGAGNLTVDGTTTSQDVTATGVGAYQGAHLASTAAKVTLSGVGNAAVRASQTLDATLTGIGSLTYYGNPSVTQHTSGVGKVTHAEG